jgi:flagellar motor switch protein FliN/FliY
MSDEKELAPLAPIESAPAGAGDLGRLCDVTVELSVEVGRTRMTLGQALALGPGSVVALNRSAREPVDLLVNGKQVARGEVVVIDDDFGLRITDVNELPEDESEPSADAPDAAAEATPAPGFEAAA